MNSDPVTARLLRHEPRLQAGGVPSEHEVLATYRSADGEAPFAFCRHGLLLDPGGQPRFVPFIEIADSGYYNHEMVERAKAVRANASRVSEPLSIKLVSGEVIDLPADVRDDGMPNLLTIAALIERRVKIHVAEERREGPSLPS